MRKAPEKFSGALFCLFRSGRFPLVQSGELLGRKEKSLLFVAQEFSSRFYSARADKIGAQVEFVVGMTVAAQII